jgi:hypothetical protein
VFAGLDVRLNKGCACARILSDEGQAQNFRSLDVLRMNKSEGRMGAHVSLLRSEWNGKERDHKYFVNEISIHLVTEITYLNTMLWYELFPLVFLSSL